MNNEKEKYTTMYLCLALVEIRSARLVHGLNRDFIAA